MATAGSTYNGTKNNIEAPAVNIKYFNLKWKIQNKTKAVTGTWEYYA